MTMELNAQKKEPAVVRILRDNSFLAVAGVAVVLTFGAVSYHDTKIEKAAVKKCDAAAASKNTAEVRSQVNAMLRTYNEEDALACAQRLGDPALVREVQNTIEKRHRELEMVPMPQK